MAWEPLPDQEHQPAGLQDVLARLHLTMGLARPDTLRTLDSNWVSLLGADLASRCRLVAVRGTELVVSVDDPAVAEHLRWSSRDLCDSVNAMCDGDAIDRLTVRVRAQGR